MARDSELIAEAGLASSTDVITMDTLPWSNGATSVSFVCTFNSSAALHSSTGICGNWNSPFGGNFLFRHNSAGTLQAYINTSAGSSAASSISSLVSVDTNHRIGFVWDGVNINSWGDGTKGGNAAKGGSLTTASVPAFRLGYINTSQKGFSGWIKDAAFWDGIALSDSAMASLTGDPGAHPLQFAPTAFWPLDNTLTDLVGGNNGTAGAGVSWTVPSVRMPNKPVPTGPIMVTAAAAAGGQSIVPLLMQMH